MTCLLQLSGKSWLEGLEFKFKPFSRAVGGESAGMWVLRLTDPYQVPGTWLSPQLEAMADVEELSHSGFQQRLGGGELRGLPLSPLGKNQRRF